jgi:hypothetical protein
MNTLYSDWEEYLVFGFGRIYLVFGFGRIYLVFGFGRIPSTKKRSAYKQNEREISIWKKRTERRAILIVGLREVKLESLEVLTWMYRYSRGKDSICTKRRSAFVFYREAPKANSSAGV